VEVYIMIVQLATGMEPISFEVSDCTTAMVQWTRSANDWARRSGVPAADGPVMGCGRKADMVNVLIRSTPVNF